MKLEQRCREIRILLCDVDGVLTDGSVNIDNQGIETKTFNIRDGLGVRLWQKAGYSFGLITGRNSHVVQVRAAETCKSDAQCACTLPTIRHRSCELEY